MASLLKLTIENGITSTYSTALILNRVLFQRDQKAL